MTINIVIGCMFSGKTSYIMNIAKMNRLIGKKVLIINFLEDTRYGSNKEIFTHDNNSMECFPCSKDLNTIKDNVKQQSFDIICINEAQFFTNLLSFCLDLVNSSVIYVCGLDGDYMKNPFGEILSLIPHSESVIKLNAICMICRDGTSASFTKRIVESDEQVLIGSQESYLPVCRKCY